MNTKVQKVEAVSKACDPDGFQVWFDGAAREMPVTAARDFITAAGIMQDLAQCVLRTRDGTRMLAGMPGARMLRKDGSIPVIVGSLRSTLARLEDVPEHRRLAARDARRRNGQRCDIFH